MLTSRNTEAAPRATAGPTSKVRPLGRDMLWSGSLYIIVFSGLEGLEAASVARRLDALIARNPRLALERRHAKGNRYYHGDRISSSPSAAVLAVLDPIPGRDTREWATELLACHEDAVFRVRLVGDDCYVVVSHVLGDFAGVLALCEYMLIGAPDLCPAGLEPVGLPPLGRALMRLVRRDPARILQGHATVFGTKLRALLKQPDRNAGAGLGSIEPIPLVCWPKPNDSTDRSKSGRPPGNAKVIASVVRAAAALCIRHDPAVSVLVDCRHWLDSSRRPMLGNLASVISIDVSPGLGERELTRLFIKSLREGTPLIKLITSHVYGWLCAALPRDRADKPSAAKTPGDVIKIVVTNLGEIRMMEALRRKFPQARFSGMPAIPMAGQSTFFIYSVKGVMELGLVSNSRLGQEEATAWCRSTLEMLNA